VTRLAPWLTVTRIGFGSHFETYFDQVACVVSDLATRIHPNLLASLLRSHMTSRRYVRPGNQ
jgi:hypothetical protein